jgi:hypothetical protein
MIACSIFKWMCALACVTALSGAVLTYSILAIADCTDVYQKHVCKLTEFDTTHGRCEIMYAHVRYAVNCENVLDRCVECKDIKIGANIECYSQASRYATDIPMVLILDPPKTVENGSNCYAPPIFYILALVIVLFILMVKFVRQCRVVEQDEMPAMHPVNPSAFYTP